MIVYIAHPDYLNELCEEIGDVSKVVGNLVFSPVFKKDICFALDAWLDAQEISFESITAAAKILRTAGKYWFLNPIENIRRSKLIESELRKLPALEHTFPIQDEIPAIGCFSLLDKNTLVFATRRWKNPPLGNYQFIEDKINPPNRAYLKLWEALSLWGSYPSKDDIAMDLGASPGGWTYVMQQFGTKVFAVDKAPLDPNIAKLPHITFLQQSAFALDPQKVENNIDWLLCDVACYPDRTYELVQQWIASGKAKNMIITIKLQGDTNFEIIDKFQKIPHGRVIHLFYNKHEATFFYPAKEHLFLSDE